jgi:uncharacterized protein YndB with AHSA1/START domain
MAMHVPDPDHLGRLERHGGQVRLTFVRRLAYPTITVWRALTEAEHLAAWFPTTIEGARVAGSPLRFGFLRDEAPSFDGEMLVFEPPSVMELRWGDEVLRFALEHDGDGSVLTLTATFDELGKAARDGAGWHACLDLLDCAIAGREAPWSSADRWSELHPVYVGRFGPDASTIGPPEEWERVHGAAERSDPR